MNIKDYIPGREVYALCVKFGRSKNYEIKKYIVRSVGRKYVKASPENFTNLIVDFYKPEQIKLQYFFYILIIFVHCAHKLVLNMFNLSMSLPPLLSETYRFSKMFYTPISSRIISSL